MKTSCRTMDNYDAIASEYYDVLRHPTCANFGELSGGFLRSRIEHHLCDSGRVLEVGAGRSTVAPIMKNRGLSLNNLILLDNSVAMLHHSAVWGAAGAQFVIQDASNSGLPSGSIDLIVSSLGDPYNCQNFWLEVNRLLSEKGICLFTTPAPEWADRFRAYSNSEEAEFLLNNGQTVAVRSYIPPAKIQETMIEDASLYITETGEFSSEKLFLPPSPKLALSAETLHLPILRGYVISQAARRT